MKDLKQFERGEQFIKDLIEEYKILEEHVDSGKLVFGWDVDYKHQIIEINDQMSLFFVKHEEDIYRLTKKGLEDLFRFINFPKRTINVLPKENLLDDVNLLIDNSDKTFRLRIDKQFGVVIGVIAYDNFAERKSEVKLSETLVTSPSVLATIVGLEELNEFFTPLYVNVNYGDFQLLLKNKNNNFGLFFDYRIDRVATLRVSGALFGELDSMYLAGFQMRKFEFLGQSQQDAIRNHINFIGERCLEIRDALEIDKTTRIRPHTFTTLYYSCPTSVRYIFDEYTSVDKFRNKIIKEEILEDEMYSNYSIINSALQLPEFFGELNIGKARAASYNMAKYFDQYVL